MKIHLIIASVLIAAGILALVYGGFSYIQDSETADLGPIEISVYDKETVNIPVWAGVTSIVLGAGVLAVPLIRRS